MNDPDNSVPGEVIQVLELYRLEYALHDQRYITEVAWEPETRSYLFRTGQPVSGGDLVNAEMALIPENSIVHVIEAVIRHRTGELQPPERPKHD